MCHETARYLLFRTQGFEISKTEYSYFLWQIAPACIRARFIWNLSMKDHKRDPLLFSTLLGCHQQHNYGEDGIQADLPEIRPMGRLEILRGVRTWLQLRNGP